MSTTLFDFEFEPQAQAPQVVLSDEELEIAFEELREHIKSLGNRTNSATHVETFISENNLHDYVPYFKEKKWLSSYGDIAPLFRKYHTIQELYDLIDDYYYSLNQYIDAGNTINWHKDTWRAISDLLPKNLAPLFEDTKKIKEKLFVITDEWEKITAIKLGWKHYSTCDESRGSKMEKFWAKPYHKHFIPYIIKMVGEINDFDEMKSLFSKPILMGRWDWWNDKFPPRPLVEKLTLTPLEIACLCEANETNAKEIVKTIFLNCGGGSRGSAIDRKDVDEIPTFTWEDYQESLSESDMLSLIDDVERLKSIVSPK